MLSTKVSVQRLFFALRANLKVSNGFSFTTQKIDRNKLPFRQFCSDVQKSVSKQPPSKRGVFRRTGKILSIALVGGSVCSAAVGGYLYYAIDDIGKRQIRTTLEGGSRFVR